MLSGSPCKQLYSGISVGLLITILCWPILPHLGLEAVWGSSFEKNWLISASIVLVAFTIFDTALAERDSWMDVIMGLAWVLFSVYIVVIVLQQPSQAWFLAAALGLRSLSVSPILWQQQHVQWWHWQAWWRDLIAALVMFTWLIVW